MLRPLSLRVMLGALLLAGGCHASSQTPADYSSFEAERGQWVLGVQGIGPADADRIRAAVEEVSEVTMGSVMVNPAGRYVAFKTATPVGDGERYGAVKNEVVKKLGELGLKVSESKTRLE